MDKPIQEIEEQTKEEDYIEGCHKENFLVPHVCPVATGGWCKDYVKCRNLENSKPKDKNWIEKVLCWKCRCLRNYTVSIRKSNHRVNGIKFEYNEMVAICNSCGEIITVPGLDDENIKALEKAYMENKGGDL